MVNDRLLFLALLFVCVSFCLFVCLSVHMHACTYICVHVFVCVCVYICVCLCMCMCMYIQVGICQFKMSNHYIILIPLLFLSFVCTSHLQGIASIISVLSQSHHSYLISSRSCHARHMQNLVIRYI